MIASGSVALTMGTVATCFTLLMMVVVFAGIPLE
jgi:hypothetical protein